MLKALIRKQFLELKEQYTPKKYRSQKRKGGVGFLLLYLLVAFSVGFAFVGMAMLLCESFHESGLDWLYYLIFNLIALAVGVVGSVFGTYATLYHAKDNEQLLAMPIRPVYLLAARMLTVLVTTFVFVAMVQVPAFGVHIYLYGTGVWEILCCIFGLLFTCLIATSLSCLLGWLVALITAHTRKNTFATVFLSLLLIALYYFVYFRLNTMLQSLAANAVTLGEKLSGNAYALKLIGLGYTGHIGGFALHALIALLVFGLTCFLLQRGFIRITTTQRGSAKAVYVARRTGQKSIAGALFGKELKRFFQSATYLLNCILGTVIVFAACIYLFIKFGAAREAVNQLMGTVPPELAELLGFIPAVAASFIISMQPVTAPTISLEGHSIWVLQSLPVRPAQVFTAKQKLCCAVNLPAALLGVCALSALLGLPWYNWVRNLLFVLVFIAFVSALGLWSNLKKPLLDWTNESVAVKQGAPVAITMFGGWAVTIACGAAAYYLSRFFNALPYLFLIPVFLDDPATTEIYTRGAEAFETL